MLIVSKHMKEQRWRAPRAWAITKVDSEKVKQAARVAELIKTLRPQIKTEFTEAIKKVGDYIDYAEIARKLAEGDVAGAIEEVNKKLVESGFFGFANRLTHAAIRAGVDEAKAIAGQAAGPAELRVVFNVTNPQTIAHLRTYEMDKIQQMSSEALASVRRAVLDGVHAGRNPLDIAREVKNYIGLTERQTAAVLNYRRMLENQNTDALTRALRDRRFDPTVTNAFSNAQALSQEQVNRMVDRYQERYLAYRAETISRTEAMRAVNNGSFMAWQQAVNEGSIDADTVVREWIYTHDDKTRDAHRAIPDMNPDGVGIDEPFDTPLGPLMYPGDPDGLPENTINCRCTVISRVVPKVDVEKEFDPDEPRDEKGQWTAVYRGEYSGNKGGNFYSTDREFARQFTQTGQDHEIMSGRIATAHIYSPSSPVYAGDENGFDRSVDEARRGGFKAVRFSEGHRQPDSIYVIDRSSIKKFNENHDEKGRFTFGGSGSSGGASASGGGSDSGEIDSFVSPNIGNLNFDQARSEIGSARQGYLKEAGSDIDHELGLRSEAHDVIGAWKDGAENSVMTVMRQADYETAKLAVVMRGYLANQKSVLVFQAGGGKNDHFLAQFDAKGSLDEIHAGLLNRGLSDHTLIPTPGGARVVVFGMDQSTADSVVKAAKRYGAHLQFRTGQGEFIGTSLEGVSDAESRADARRVYQKIIQSAQISGLGRGRDIAGAWDRIRSRWSAVLKAIIEWIALEKFWKFDPDQPRDYHGRWTSTGAGDENQKENKDQMKARANTSLTSIDQVIERVPGNQARLAEAGRRIAVMAGVKRTDFKNPGGKTQKKDKTTGKFDNYNEEGIARYLVKAGEKGRGLGGVADATRIGFLIDTPSQKDKIVSELRKQFPAVVDEGWARNYWGYYDAKAYVQHPDGMLGEVQIMQRDLARAKSSDGPGAGGGHKIYDEFREKDPTSAEYKDAVKRSRVIYQRAADKAGEPWRSLYQRFRFQR